MMLTNLIGTSQRYAFNICIDFNICIEYIIIPLLSHTVSQLVSIIYKVFLNFSIPYNNIPKAFLEQLSVGDKPFLPQRAP
jgi:hypothetical protein